MGQDSISKYYERSQDHLTVHFCADSHRICIHHGVDDHWGAIVFNQSTTAYLSSLQLEKSSLRVWAAVTKASLPKAHTAQVPTTSPARIATRVWWGRGSAMATVKNPRYATEQRQRMNPITVLAAVIVATIASR